MTITRLAGAGINVDGGSDDDKTSHLLTVKGTTVKLATCGPYKHKKSLMKIATALAI